MTGQERSLRDCPLTRYLGNQFGFVRCFEKCESDGVGLFKASSFTFRTSSCKALSPIASPKQTWDDGYELYKKYVIEKTEVTAELEMI